MVRPHTICTGLFATALALSLGCASGGHVNLFGYTTTPPYDENIRTVYVPIFENVTFRRGLEFDLTRAIVREIEAKTPFKVVNCREQADTELHGRIINRNKRLVNGNQLGEVREAELTLAVELQWRDLRAGNPNEFLSREHDPRRDTFSELDRDDPARINRLRAGRSPNIILVQPAAHFIPELGGSVTSAEKQLVDRLAVQIVSMMERPW